MWRNATSGRKGGKTTGFESLKERGKDPPLELSIGGKGGQGEEHAGFRAGKNDGLIGEKSSDPRGENTKGWGTVRSTKTKGRT